MQLLDALAVVGAPLETFAIAFIEALCLYALLIAILLVRKGAETATVEPPQAAEVEHMEGY